MSRVNYKLIRFLNSVNKGFLWYDGEKIIRGDVRVLRKSEGKRMKEGNKFSSSVVEKITANGLIPYADILLEGTFGQALSAALNWSLQDRNDLIAVYVDSGMKNKTEGWVIGFVLDGRYFEKQKLFKGGDVK
jgi:hypothetical protein